MRIEDERTLAGLVLAIGVFVALMVPDVSHVFAPYLLHSLFFVVVFSLLPFARRDVSELTTLHPAAASLIVWQQFLLPAFAISVGHAVGLDDELLFLVVVVLTSGSLFASPTLAQIMGLDQKFAVQSVILSTLAAPVSIFLSFLYISENQSSLNLGEFAVRVGIFLVAPICVLAVVRRLTRQISANQSKTLERASRWGSVIALLIFCFALEEQVALMLVDNPAKVLGYLAASITILFGAAVLTRLVMARFGGYAATTACVLASFRNVGLTYGLIANGDDSDLMVFVGVCQIPMFFTPILFDLLFGNSRIRINPEKSANEPNGSACHAPSGISNPTSLGNRTSASFKLDSNSVYQRRDYLGGNAQKAAQINENFAHYTVSMEPEKQNSSNMTISNTATATAVPLDNLPLADESKYPSEALASLEVRREEAQEQIKNIKDAISRDRSAAFYLGALLVLIGAGMAGIWQANKYFAPMLFNQKFIEQVADAHISGKNFAVYDLNINIRDLREATIARMPEAPELVVLGASQWQEASVDLIKDKKFYNSHVHRDYYEDMLASTEMYVRHNKLPKEMIITIRDNLFTPVKDRTDFLWLPGIKYYRAMADRLGIEAHGWWETLPVNTWRELVSLPLLWDQASRELTAGATPHPTDQTRLESFDILLPGGSIAWSGDHKRLFSADRARREALSFAETRRNDPPRIDPKAIEPMEALLTFLLANNVKVTLAQPQFNPLFWDAVQGSAYMDGLKKVDALTRHWAKKFDLAMIGGFSPQSVGCTPDMYIDAEHANSKCLGMLLQQYSLLDDKADFPGSVTW